MGSEVYTTKDGTFIMASVNRSWSVTPKGQNVRYPLPYTSSRKTVKSVSPDFKTNSSAGGGGSWTWTDEGVGLNSTALYNRCYQKFIGRVHGSVQGAVDVFEWGQTASMLRTALSAVRHPLFTVGTLMRDAARSPKFLGVLPKNILLRDVPNAWLAFHFGVEPLIGEIHELVEMLNSGKPKEEWIHETLKHQVSNAYDGQWRGDFKHAVRIGTMLNITNPNLHALNSLGLINPAGVAWELVPFSFVVDWFIPVGAFIGGFTDFVGVSISHSYQTDFYISETKFDLPPRPTWKCETRNVHWTRILTVPSIKLRGSLHVPNLGLNRAATSISLLLQQLKPLKGR